MRVGDRTDYDRLFLEIETDGIISPEEAFWQASEILDKHFSLLTSAFKPEESLVQEKPKKEKKDKKEKKKPILKLKKKNEKEKKGKKTK